MQGQHVVLIIDSSCTHWVTQIESSDDGTSLPELRSSPLCNIYLIQLI